MSASVARRFHGALLGGFLLLTGFVPAQAGADLLPADTDGVLTIESLSRFYDVFGIPALRQEYPERFAMMSADMVEEIGIDLLDLESMTREGFDPDRPIHIAMFAGPPHSVAILVPGDKNAARWLRASMEQEGARFTDDVEYGGVTIHGTAKGWSALFTTDDYVGLVVCDKETGGSAVDAAKRIRDGVAKGTLAESGDYRRVMKKVPGDADLTFFSGPEFYAVMSELQGKNAPDAPSSEDMMQMYDMWGMRNSYSALKGRFGTRSIQVDGYSWVGKDSRLLDWYRVSTDPVPFLQRVPAQPLLGLIARINLGAFWRSIREVVKTTEDEAADKIEDGFAEANRELGIDVERDVIDQINGNVGLVIDRAALFGSDALVLIQVVDPNRFNGTLSKVVARINEDIAVKQGGDAGASSQKIQTDTYNGTDYYFVPSPPAGVICFGLVDDHLVVSLSQERFQAIVAGGEGFAKTMENPDVRAALAAKGGSMFYVDFELLRRDVEGFLPMLGPDGAEISAILQELDEMVSVTGLEGEGGMRQKWSLTSTRDGIWKYLADLVVAEVEMGTTE